METKYFNLVKAIVEEGSIAKAKDILNLTQSALSHQLKLVEDQLGFKLFERKNKKLIPTDAGNSVYQTSIAIKKEIEQLKFNLSKLDSNTTGKIRLSAACITNYSWLPGALKEFNKHYPNVDVNIVLNATGNPLEELLKNNLDIAVVSIQRHLTKIKFINLFNDEMLAVFPHEHEWKNKKYVTAKDFIDKDLLIYSKVLIPKDIIPRKVKEIPFTESMIELIGAGYGISIMPRWAVKPYVESKIINVLPINKKGLFRNYYVGIRKNQSHPDYVFTFIKFLKKQLILE